MDGERGNGGVRAAIVPRNVAALGGDRIFEFDGYDPLDFYGPDRIAFHRLRERFEAHGDEIATVDRVDPATVDVCLFVDTNYDYLDEVLSLDDPPALAYVMREPPSVVPENASANLVRLAGLFDRVFTWNPTLSDTNDRFREYDIPQYLDAADGDDRPFSDRDLLVNVTSRKYSDHPEELYSAREAVIAWYDDHHPEVFTLYGQHWNDPPRPYEIYNYGTFSQPTYETYAGLAETKAGVYRDHRFVLCFENMTGIDGYLTEKLFDCFRAGAVPVYWGAEDIERYVPSETFVDYREFGTPAALHDHLAAVDEAEHAEMVAAAREFLDDAAETLGPDQYAEAVHEGVRGLSRERDPPDDLRERVATRGRYERLARHDTDRPLPSVLLGLARTLLRSPDVVIDDPGVVLRALRD